MTSSRRGASQDRGAALVELVLLLPLLSLLVFGTMELGRGWIASNRVIGATSQAARIGAMSGSRADADRDLLVALRAGMSASELAGVDRVVVFKATDPTGSVPAGCVKAVGDPSEIGNSSCNTYNGTTLRAVTPTSMVGFGTVGAKDSYWAPTGRNDELSDPPDYLGVWVRTRYQGTTSFSFSRVTLTASKVFRIQPDLAG
jgi:hypothetical protein